MSSEATPYRRTILILAFASALSPLAVHSFAPALPVVRADFDISLSKVQLTMSIPQLVIGPSFLVFGFLADRIGRRFALLAGIILYCVGALLSLAAQTLEALIFGRVLIAIGGSAGFIVARAVIAAIFPPPLVTRSLAQLVMAVTIVPTLAPLFGGFAIEILGWRSLFAFLALISLVVGLCFIWGVGDRAEGAGRSQGSVGETLAEMVRLATKAPFLVVALQNAFIASLFMSFVSMAPHVLADQGEDAAAYGVWFVAVAAAYFFGSLVSTRLRVELPVDSMLLVSSAVAILGVGISLAAYLAGWWNPLAVFLPASVLLFAHAIVLPHAQARALAIASQQVGGGTGLLGFMQTAMGAIAIQLAAVLPFTSSLALLIIMGVSAAGAFGCVALLRERTGAER